MVTALRGRSLVVGRVNEQRFRHGTDVFLLSLSVLSGVTAALVAVPQSSVESSLVRFLESLPEGVADALVLAAPLFLIWATLVLVLLLACLRWRAARDLLAASLLAVVVAAVLARVATGSWAAPPGLFESGSGPDWYPPLGLTLPAVVATVAVPYVVVPMRNIGRVIAGAASLGLLLAFEATPSAIAAALAAAGVAAAAVHVCFGTTRGVPTIDALARALVDLGVDATFIGPPERASGGAFVVSAQSSDGTALVVKVRGRDAHDTELVHILWRSIWFRDWATRRVLGRVRQAHHEALVTMLAARAGVRAPEIVAVGVLPNRDAVIVLGDVPIELALRAAPPGPELVAHAWDSVSRLHSAGIGHGQLDDESFARFDDALGVSDFSGAELSASAYRRRADDAQTYVTLALALDSDIAASGTVAELGVERVARFLPYVQPGVLTPRQRLRIRQHAVDLDALRDSLAAAAQITPPELEQLQRVSVRTIVQSGLLVLAFVVLASAVADLDIDALGEAIREATWQGIVAGLLVAQTPRFAQAASTLGATPIPLPFGWVYALQLSMSYLGFAVPSSAARVAVNVRFFQRQGLGAGAALTVGALDSVVGIGMQVILVLGITVAAGPLDLPIDFSDAGPADIAGMVAMIAVVAIAGSVVLLASGGRRTAAVRWLRELLRDARATLSTGWTPSRGALLVGGNLAAELLFAAALTCFVRAFGYDIPYVEILLVNASVSLVAGLLPVPGGIGIVEGGIALGLVLAGVPEESAFAIAIVHRIATFYLPPLWGYAAFRALERNGQL